MRIKPSHLLFLLTALNITGCAPTLYEMMENGRTLACDSLHGQEREECLMQARKSYDEYEREREEAISKDK